METNMYYKRVFIHSINDLPKEYLRLISHYKDEENVFYRVYEPPYDADETAYILKNIDWYLKPVEIPEVNYHLQRT